MKGRKLICGLMLGFSLAVVGGTVGLGVANNGYVVEAVGDLEDNIGGTQNQDKQNNNSNNVNNGNADNTEANDNGVADFLKGQRPMKEEHLEIASEALTPLTNVIGNLMGGIIVITSALLFLITALDLLYITVPFLRGLLYKGGQQQQMGGGMYGRQAQSQGSTFQLISDEAVQCAVLLGNSQQQPQMGGGGMYGGMMQQQQPKDMPTKSVILTYFKKRLIFMIIFAICIVTLTTSLFLGTGVNLALWLTKLVNIVNTYIPR